MFRLLLIAFVILSPTPAWGDLLGSHQNIIKDSSMVTGYIVPIDNGMAICVHAKFKDKKITNYIYGLTRAQVKDLLKDISCVEYKMIKEQ